MFIHENKISNLMFINWNKISNLPHSVFGG